MGKKIVFVNTGTDIIDLIQLVSDVPFEQAETVEEAEKDLLA